MQAFRHQRRVLAEGRAVTFVAIDLLTSVYARIDKRRVVYLNNLVAWFAVVDEQVLRGTPVDVT